MTTRKKSNKQSRFHAYANPKRLIGVINRLFWPMVLLCGLLTLSGLSQGLFVSPADYQQGDSVRLMYVHVPAAWMGMMVYGLMGACAISAYIFRHPTADLLTLAAASAGMLFTGLALLTGMIWGKPMWGTAWVWDARLTSVLVLFFIYGGYLLLVNSHSNLLRGIQKSRLLVLLGLVNLPVIKFSVDWWNTLHQPASVVRLDGPSIAPEMLSPLILMAVAYFLFFLIVWGVNFKALYYKSSLEQTRFKKMRSKK